MRPMSPVAAAGVLLLLAAPALPNEIVYADLACMRPIVTACIAKLCVSNCQNNIEQRDRVVRLCSNPLNSVDYDKESTKKLEGCIKKVSIPTPGKWTEVVQEQRAAVTAVLKERESRIEAAVKALEQLGPDPRFSALRAELDELRKQLQAHIDALKE